MKIFVVCAMRCKERKEKYPVFGYDAHRNRFDFLEKYFRINYFFPFLLNIEQKQGVKETLKGYIAHLEALLQRN